MALNGGLMDSGTEPDNSFDPERQNFCRLPLPLWLKIFSHLEGRDRLALSVTCRTLYKLCMNSSILWQSATINIGSKTPNSDVNVDGAALNQTEQSILREHCHQMTDVTFQIKTNGNLRFDKRSYSLLVDAAKCWPLFSFQVKLADSRISVHDSTDPVIPKHVEHLLTTCLTSPSARRLTILVLFAPKWVNEDGYSGLLEALKNALFTSSLICLSIMNSSPRYCDHSGELCKVVGRFTNLQHLGIDLSSLCNTLLDNFPKHMKRIIISVYGSEDFKEVINWQSLCAYCPQLKVALYFKGNGSHQTLPQLLPSVVPVSEVDIGSTDKQCRYYCRQTEILQQLPLYSKTLRVLTCGHDSIQTIAYRNETLITTVSQCPNLDRLYVYGSISSNAIITLAKMRKWVELRFDTASITYGDSSDRNDGLQTLSAEVSKILGRDFEWKPLLVFQDPRTGLHKRPLQLKMRRTVITV